MRFSWRGGQQPTPEQEELRRLGDERGRRRASLAFLRNGFRQTDEVVDRCSRFVASRENCQLLDHQSAAAFPLVQKAPPEAKPFVSPLDQRLQDLDSRDANFAADVQGLVRQGASISNAKTLHHFVATFGRERRRSPLTLVDPATSTPRTNTATRCPHGRSATVYESTRRLDELLKRLAGLRSDKSITGVTRDSPPPRLHFYNKQCWTPVGLHAVHRPAPRRTGAPQKPISRCERILRLPRHPLGPRPRRCKQHFHDRSYYRPIYVM